MLAMITGAASGQNFQAIQDNGHRLFDTGYGLRGIDVDSTEVIGEDLIFYLTRTVQEVANEWGCYDPQAPSWMGDHVRISPDGTHLFFNLDGDTIRFEMQAASGDTWRCMRPMDCTYKVKLFLFRKKPFLKEFRIW